MAKSQWWKNPLLLFFTFSSLLFLMMFMGYPKFLKHEPVIDPHAIHTRIDASLLTSFGSRSYGEEGKVENFGGLNSYITGSPNSKKGILVVTDIYGYEKPNLRKLVDKIAGAGYYVVAPDFYSGDAYVPSPQRPYDSWLKDHPAEKGAQDAKPVIEAFKSKGISRIGLAGFCWGGKVVTILANRDDLKAVAMAHPAYVLVDDIKGVKVPIEILGGELDTLTPPALVKQYEEVLATKTHVHSLVKVFPGVAHGWTLRYNETDKAAVKSATTAHRYILAWFKKHV